MINIKKVRTAKTQRPTIHFMIGLPGSGKSSKAWEIVQSDVEKNTLRINKDDIRKMMKGEDHSWSYEYESAVNAAAKSAGIRALELGFDVVVDDMGFNMYHRKGWMEYADDQNLNLVSYFVDTDELVCKKRCDHRSKENGNPVTGVTVADNATRYKDTIIQTRNGKFI